MFGGLLSEPDKAVLEPESAREEFAASMRQGFEFGWRGFYDDDQAIMKEWGFDPTTITVPVSVWFGDQDLMVPRTHGSGWRRVCRRRASASSPETGTSRWSSTTSTNCPRRSRRRMRKASLDNRTP